MKWIIDGKLYDMEKSEKVCDIYPDSQSGYSVYKTQNGSLFIFNSVIGKIANTDQNEIKNILGKENVERYIELFGLVEEA